MLDPVSRLVSAAVLTTPMRFKKDIVQSLSDGNRLRVMHDQIAGFLTGTCQRPSSLQASPSAAEGFSGQRRLLTNLASVLPSTNIFLTQNLHMARIVSVTGPDG